MVPPLDYFASGRNYSMKADYEIGLVPPLAYFASGGNHPIILRFPYDFSWGGLLQGSL